jgi:spore coat polysaccharide biosynthesis protein SpsF
LGSTRLPGKVLYHLGDRRLLQWVIDRCDETDTVETTVAALGDEPENEAVTEYCSRADMEHVVGPEDDLLARHVAVADHTDCEALVRITGDCPFVPAEEIDRVVEAHRDNDAVYTTNFTEAMPIGTAVDVLDVEVLYELQELGETHPVKLLRAGESKWDVTRTDDAQWHQYSDLHLAVDTPSDYWLLSDAISAVGSRPDAVAEWLTQ